MNNISGSKKIMLNENCESQKKFKLDRQQKKELLASYIKNLDEEQKMKFWIKTLLSTYNIFPEIIKTVDKVIELKASSVSFASDIYNFKSTYDQVEQVIDLTERKNYLLNIHCITRKILESVSAEDFDFLEKKFVYNWRAEDLAGEFNISNRTVYRKIDRLIDDIFVNLKNNNWTSRFIESQLGDESWLKQKYFKQIQEYFKSINYGLTEENSKPSNSQV